MQNKDKIILDLCGGTGSWSKYYKDNGYDVRVITLPDYNVLTYEPPKNVYGILAAPPCTMFSIVRNDKTAKKPRDLKGGMEIVNACLRIIHTCLYDNFRVGQGLKFWALENPASGYLKRFLGKPAMIFEPYEYGDPYTKKTALWGEFKEPKKNIVEPRNFEHPTSKGCRDFTKCVEYYADLKQIPEGYLQKTGLSKRTVLRSMTPLGFAKAFYEANK